MLGFVALRARRWSDESHHCLSGHHHERLRHLHNRRRHVSGHGCHIPCVESGERQGRAMGALSLRGKGRLPAHWNWLLHWGQRAFGGSGTAPIQNHLCPDALAFTRNLESGIQLLEIWLAAQVPKAAALGAEYGAEVRARKPAHGYRKLAHGHSSRDCRKPLD